MSNARLKELAVSESGFVFDPYSGGTFTLNATGQVILRALQEGLAPASIVTRLRAEFDQAPARIEDDVQDFLRTLQEYGLTSNQTE
jgi:PqqD family protein of HPr-rel-A system